MAKKLILVSPVLVCAAVITGLVLSGVGGAGQEATPAELEQAKANIVSLIEAGDMAGADAALDELLALADSEQKGRVIHEIAGAYKKVKDFAKTLWLSQYVVDTWPGADYAVWCRMEVALCNIELGNDAAASEAVDKLSADYANDANLPWTLYLVGQRYDYGRMYDEARGVYEQVAGLANAGQWGGKAQLGAARVEIASLIESGSWSLAVQEVDLMMAGFADNPDMAQSLAWLGERFGWARRYGEAKDVFDILIRDYPASSFAQGAQLWSARMNCCGLVNQGEDEDALAAIDKLIEDFGSDERLAEAVYWIGKEYEWKRGTVEDRTTRYGTPESVYERLVQEFGDTSFGRDAAWDKRRLEHRTQIFTLMKDGEPNEVAAAIADMEADLAGRPELVSELYWVGREYEEYPDKYAPAKQIYQRIIEQYPGSIEAGQCRLDVVRSDIAIQIEANDINGAEAGIDSFVADFNGHPYAGLSLRSMAKQYYEKAMGLRQGGDVGRADENFRGAKRVYGRIIDVFDENSPDVPVAYYFSGRMCQLLRDYACAAANFQIVVEEWPDYRYAGGAQCAVGYCYAAMVKLGEISEAEAGPVIEEAYERVLERYPDCYLADYAAFQLGEMNYTRGDLAAAEQYYKLFLELARPGDVRIKMVEAELKKLEEMLK